jgi:hypothetical protein
MFEKEAEEYREKEKDKGYYWVTQEMEQSELDTIVYETFKDGAEFGYNKAKEEMQEQGLALQSDMDKTIEQNISLKAQIEKMKCCNRTSYVKGLRTMANAVKKYDREYGAWTDYVENTVNRVLNNLLKEIKEDDE